MYLRGLMLVGAWPGVVAGLMCSQPKGERNELARGGLHLARTLGTELSQETISPISPMPSWSRSQNRPLEEIYPIIIWTRW